MTRLVFIALGLIFASYAATEYFFLLPRPLTCEGSFTLEGGVDPRTGQPVEYGPYSAVDLGCPKSVDQIKLLMDVEGKPLLINGKPQPLTLPKVCDTKGNEIIFCDDRPYWWQPSDEIRRRLVYLSVALATICFGIAGFVSRRTSSTLYVSR